MALVGVNRPNGPAGVFNNEMDAEDDPALLAFLEYLNQQMTAHPELIVEADYEQLDRIAKLIQG
jgi:hypothetical protein